MKAKYYEQLAEAIRKSVLYQPYMGFYKCQFLDALCIILAAENPKFQREKFLELCK